MSLDKISTKSRSQSEIVQTSDVEKLTLVSDELEVRADLGANSINRSATNGSILKLNGMLRSRQFN